MARSLISATRLLAAPPAPSPIPCTTSSRIAAIIGSVRRRALVRSPNGNFLKARRGFLLVCKANEKDNIVVANASSNSDLLRNWRDIGLWLFGAGFVLGPLLDGIHSRVELQIYDNWAVDIGGLHTNLWVFPILGTFYSVVGLLHLVLDTQFARMSRFPLAPSLTKVAFSFIYLVLYLELSAELYQANVPYNIEAYILFAAAQLNWVLFEKTWWGLALASLVGVVCPLAEIPIIKLFWTYSCGMDIIFRWFSLWHYSKPNISVLDEGLVTWVLCCYFAYTPFLANLSRWLRLYLNDRPTGA